MRNGNPINFTALAALTQSYFIINGVGMLICVVRIIGCKFQLSSLRLVFSSFWIAQGSLRSVPRDGGIRHFEAQARGRQT